MPGLNGTGPFGQGQMTGRGFGRCRCAPMREERMLSGVQIKEGEAPETTEQAQKTVPQAIVYGAGHGGIPRGCGHGRAFGGGRGNCRQRESI